MQPLLGFLRRGCRQEVIRDWRGWFWLVVGRAVSFPKRETAMGAVEARGWGIVDVGDLRPRRTLGEYGCLIRRLIFLFFMGRPFLHFLSIYFLFSVCTLRLEDFDLAAGRVQVLCVLSVPVLLEGIDLHSERHPLLPAMLPHGELSADAVHLKGSDTKHHCH